DHVHGDESADHDHDHDLGPAGPPEENPLWLHDNLSLVSVGIDIGSAGTQVIFSRLHMRRLGEDLSSRYFVVARDALYQSPVTFTPYVDDVRIDERALGRIIDDAYQAAGLHPDEIDTGSVILTGEALRRENAQAIAELLAEMGGEFVCATAGHHMEAMLAAYGSGAAKVSHDQDLRVLNVDIGGGTTKLAVIEGGRVLETAAVHIGGRLLVVNGERRITRLDPAGHALARRAGLQWGLGEYVYGREERDFGDLGRRLGRALRRRVDEGCLPWRLLPAGECIRATAFGASEYSVQLSGNTVYISQPGELLPRKNLQVLRPAVRLDGAIDADQLAAAIRSHFEAFDVLEGQTEIALAFRWRGEPSFERLSAFARAITISLRRTIELRKPLYIILDGDIAQTLGAILKEEWGVASEVLVLDGIALRDFDFIDLGRIRMPSHTVPVTIKSLVFSQDPRVPHEHRHHHGDDRGHGHHHHHHHH